mgnify:FL=1
MDTISDFFITIKNAYLAKKDRAVIPFSKMKYEMARILEEKGFVSAVRKKRKKGKNLESKEFLYLEVKLKYEEGVPAMSGVRLISKPGRRIYIKKDEIRPVRSGYGVLIISTSKGVRTGEEARELGVGGQAIAQVW